MPRTRCRHPRARVTSRTYCYSGPVRGARRENIAAHGGVCDVETCGACGATRATNINGSALERGTWGGAS